MRNETELTEACRQYAAAYAAHYVERDLPLALQLYKKLIASHPSAREADYARTQAQNIVNVVVPKQERLDAQMELVLLHFATAGEEVEALELYGASWQRRKGGKRGKRPLPKP